MTVDERLDQVMALLNSIDERLPPAVASAKQIQGEYGNPKVNFDPKQWRGTSYKGSKASECEADFCDAYAETLEYMARNPKPDSDPKYIGYNRKDAKLFRRWAIEKRAGRAPSPAASKTSNAALFKNDAPPLDDDVPFVTASAFVALPLDRWRGVF